MNQKPCVGLRRGTGYIIGEPAAGSDSTHVRTHAHARTNARTYARTHTRTHARARTRTHTHTHTHARTHTRNHPPTHPSVAPVLVRRRLQRAQALCVCVCVCARACQVNLPDVGGSAAPGHRARPPGGFGAGARREGRRSGPRWASRGVPSVCAVGRRVQAHPARCGPGSGPGSRPVRVESTPHGAGPGGLHVERSVPARHARKGPAGAGGARMASAATPPAA